MITRKVASYKKGGSRNIWASRSYRSAVLGFLSRKVRLKNNQLMFYRYVVGRRAHDSENLVFVNH